MRVFPFSRLSRPAWLRTLAVALKLALIGALVGVNTFACEGQRESPPERGRMTSALSERGVVVRSANSSSLLSSTEVKRATGPHCRTTQPLAVLFIGNSYTFYHDMPRLVAQLAGSAGCSLDVVWATNGGYQLSLHARDPTTLSAILSRPWDVVVLQNQSQEAAFLPDELREKSLPAVKSLARAIYGAHPKVQLLLYSTWGRRAGDRANCAYNPEVCTFDGHTEANEVGYSAYAEAVGGDVVRAGRAFQFVSRDASATVPFADLYERDGSHPSLFGSYLVACVFFYQLTGVSPEGQAFPAALLPEEAAYLQQIAAMTVEGEPLESPGASVVTEERLVARCSADDGDRSRPAVTEHMQGASTHVVLFEGTCSDWYLRTEVKAVASSLTTVQCASGSCSTDSIDTWSTKSGTDIPPGSYSVFVSIDADASGGPTAEDFEACEDSAFSVGEGRVVTIDRFYPASSFS